MSGKYFNIVPYGVTEDTNTIDYDEVRRIALECKPKLILAGASAYPRIIDFKKFADIASEVGAYFMVDMHISQDLLQQVAIRHQCRMQTLLLQQLTRL